MCGQTTNKLQNFSNFGFPNFLYRVKRRCSLTWPLIRSCGTTIGSQESAHDPPLSLIKSLSTGHAHCHRSIETKDSSAWQRARTTTNHPRRFLHSWLADLSNTHTMHSSCCSENADLACALHGILYNISPLSWSEPSSIIGYGLRYYISAQIHHSFQYFSVWSPNPGETLSMRTHSCGGSCTLTPRRTKFAD